MPVDIDHPAVVDYVARLEEAAAALPPGQRAELVADIRAHLAEGLADVDDPVAVQEILDRLGDPADIVAEELREVAVGAPPTAPVASVAPVAPAPGAPAGLAAPGAMPPGGQVPPGPRPWGPLEIAVLVLLTVGNLLVVVGPTLGVALAWLSERWNRRQKLVITAIGGAAVVFVFLLAMMFFASASSIQPAPARGDPPAVSATPVPAPAGTVVPSSPSAS